MVQNVETESMESRLDFCGVVDLEYGGGGDCLGRRYSLVPLTR